MVAQCPLVCHCLLQWRPIKENSLKGQRGVAFPEVSIVMGFCLLGLWGSLSQTGQMCSYIFDSKSSFCLSIHPSIHPFNTFGEGSHGHLCFLLLFLKNLSDIVILPILLNSIFSWTDSLSRNDKFLMPVTNKEGRERKKYQKDVLELI